MHIFPLIVRQLRLYNNSISCQEKNKYLSDKLENGILEWWNYGIMAEIENILLTLATPARFFYEPCFFNQAESLCKYCILQNKWNKKGRTPGSALK